MIDGGHNAAVRSRRASPLFHPFILPPIPVTDPLDPRLADFVGLRDRDLAREREGLFVGEQFLIVERMLRLPGVVRSVLVGEPFLERVAAICPDSVALLVAPMGLLEAVAGFPVHRGVLAIGVRTRIAQFDPDALAASTPSDAPRTLLCCEEITNADNIGQLFRTAAALAVDGVLLSPGCHDPLYRRAIRVSIGHSLTTPWSRSRDWTSDLERLRSAHGYRLIGAALDGRAVALDGLNLGDRNALIVGTEFSGLSAQALELCDDLVRIPMAPGVDSLNVASAAAICLNRISRRGRA